MQRTALQLYKKLIMDTYSTKGWRAVTHPPTSTTLRGVLRAGGFVEPLSREMKAGEACLAALGRGMGCSGAKAPPPGRWGRSPRETPRAGLPLPTRAGQPQQGFLPSLAALLQQGLGAGVVVDPGWEGGRRRLQTEGVGPGPGGRKGGDVGLPGVARGHEKTVARKA
jgi:hypothetical protein